MARPIYFSCNFRFEQTCHRFLQVFRYAINDIVEPDIDAFFLGDFRDAFFGDNVETDNNRVRCLGQNDVAFGNAAGRGVKDFDFDLLGAQFGNIFFQNIDRTLNVGTQDDVEFLDFARFNLAEQIVECNKCSFGQACFLFAEL